MGDSPSANGNKAVLLPALTCCIVLGRHVVDNDKGSICFDWPGVRLTFRNVTGSKTIMVRMRGSRGTFGYRVLRHQDDTSAEPSLIGEGTLRCRRAVFHHSRDYRLASGLDPARKYSLEFWKRDDPQGACGVEVEGLVVDSGASAQLNDPHATTSSPRYLEFVGDEDTLGYQNLAPGYGSMFLRRRFGGSNTDATKSFPSFLAAELQRDYSIVAKSGIGAQYSKKIGTNMCRAFQQQLYYDTSSTRRTPGNPEPSPEAVVVFLGRNDQTALADSCCCYRFYDTVYNDYDESMEETLCSCFINLLKVVRARYPFPRDSVGDTMAAAATNPSPPLVKIVVIIPRHDAKLSQIGSAYELFLRVSIQRAAWKRAVGELGGEASGLYILQVRHDPQIALNSKKAFTRGRYWNVDSCERWARSLVEPLREILET